LKGRIPIAILALAVCAASGAAQGTKVPGARYESVEFAPAHLHGTKVKFNIIFPEGYDTVASRRYPVLYLLHGYSGDYSDWVTNSKLLEYTPRFQEIVVNPEGGGSWYVNNYADPTMQWEDYIIADLIPYVDSHYRTVAARNGRAIAGLSMGGYGAMMIGLKHYEKFAAIASMSGALEAAEGPWYNAVEADAKNAPQSDSFMTNLAKDLTADYGPADNSARGADDPFELIKKVPVDEMPQIYFSCGEDDELVRASRRLAVLLTHLKIPYEYREIPGKHEWAVWNRQIQVILAIQAPVIGATEIPPGE
jgi:putative tributyrin esterase